MTTDRPDRRLVLLGGVPGAGKTTALKRLARHRPDLHVIDPEALRERVEEFVRSTPYRVYRPVLHAVNAIRVLAVILQGPSAARGPVVVHDPATRPRRRRCTAWLARMCGWDTALVFIDVSVEEALEGQRRRGRVVPASSFARHWARWEVQRSGMAPGDARSVDDGRWSEVLLADRANVEQVLLDVLHGSGGPGLRRRCSSCGSHLL